MFMIVTAAWLSAFAGNVMAHPNGGTMDTGFGLGGPPVRSVTMAPQDGTADAAPDLSNVAPDISDTIDDDRPAADLADAPAGLADQERPAGAQDLAAYRDKAGAASH